MKTSNIIFFGSSPFSVIVLERLVHSSQFIVHSVVTTQDKPVGRHLKLTPNPVKVLAQKNDIPVFETMNDYRMTTNDNSMTVGLVAAYGKIILKDVLDKFNGQIYNIHPSLLPKYRGPSPLQQQILDGVTATGVTIIQLDEQMDHGPILAQEKDIIRSDDTWITLGNRLFSLGADLSLKFLLEPKTYHLEPQSHSQATYTKKLTRADSFMPWEEFNSQMQDPQSLDRKFRAFSPWPGIWTTTPQGKRMKLISLDIPKVQLENHSPLPWKQLPFAHLL